MKNIKNIDNEDIIFKNNHSIIIPDDQDELIISEELEFDIDIDELKCEEKPTVDEFECEEIIEIVELPKIRITFPFLTKYEEVLLLGYRTLQIIHGAPILINNPQIQEPYEIAKAELNEKVIPFQIKRQLPNGSVEIWDISELQLL